MEGVFLLLTTLKREATNEMVTNSNVVAMGHKLKSVNAKASENRHKKIARLRKRARGRFKSGEVSKKEWENCNNKALMLNRDEAMQRVSQTMATCNIELRVYECNVCGRWHLTSRLGSEEGEVRKIKGKKRAPKKRLAHDGWHKKERVFDVHDRGDIKQAKTDASQKVWREIEKGTGEEVLCPYMSLTNVHLEAILADLVERDTGDALRFFHLAALQHEHERRGKSRKKSGR